MRQDTDSGLDRPKAETGTTSSFTELGLPYDRDDTVSKAGGIHVLRSSSEQADSGLMPLA